MHVRGLMQINRLDWLSMVIRKLLPYQFL